MTALLLLPVFVCAPGLQDSSRPGSRSKAQEVEPRTAHADILGTSHVSANDLFGGGFMSVPGGNPTFTMMVVNGDENRVLTGLDGFVGFAAGSTNRVLAARAKVLREVAPGTWEPAADGRDVGKAEIDERGVISITDLAVPPGGRIRLFVDMARTPDGPYAFGFRAEYR
jgi:hypothetical protein